jgi:hypothetical protein
MCSEKIAGKSIVACTLPLNPKRRSSRVIFIIFWEGIDRDILRRRIIRLRGYFDDMLVVGSRSMRRREWAGMGRVFSTA